MTTQIKIFSSHDRNALEREVNEFIADKTITSVTYHEYSCDVINSLTSVLVVYES